jgi:dCTP deaminase
MILTDREIMIAIESRQLIIDPQPRAEAFSSTSVDLTLDRPGRIWKAQGGGFPIRPGHRDYRYSEALRLQAEVTLDSFTLGPKAFLLAWTKERVALPITSRLAARVEGKSSLARLGIGVHITAPTIHAGFEGQIQLEISISESTRSSSIPG